MPVTSNETVKQETPPPPPPEPEQKPTKSVKESNEKPFSSNIPDIPKQPEVKKELEKPVQEPKLDTPPPKQPPAKPKKKPVTPDNKKEEVKEPPKSPKKKPINVPTPPPSAPRENYGVSLYKYLKTIDDGQDKLNLPVQRTIIAVGRELFARDKNGKTPRR